jgi:hypothetical protein
MMITEYDAGLGTCYERHALYALLEKLAMELRIESSLEGPFDGIAGVMGINSIALARRSVRATVVLPSQEHIDYAQQFFELENCRSGVDFACSAELPSSAPVDLVWNFNCLPQCKDYEEVLRQMVRSSRRYVLIFIPNTRNYGFWVHRLYHAVKKEPWNHGDVRIMDARMISCALERMGFRTVRRLVVDVPWWPDIHTPIEEVAGSFLPFLKPFLKQPRRLEIYKYNHQNFPYFHPQRRAALLQVFSAHPNFEHARFPLLKLLFAHHRGILAERAA